MQPYIKKSPLPSLLGIEARNSRNREIRFQSLSQNSCRDFWELWEQHQNYFYCLCLRWMNDNSTDAEDALIQAIIKASNKWPKILKKFLIPKLG